MSCHSPLTTHILLYQYIQVWGDSSVSSLPASQSRLTQSNSTLHRAYRPIRPFLREPHFPFPRASTKCKLPHPKPPLQQQVSQAVRITVRLPTRLHTHGKPWPAVVIRRLLSARDNSTPLPADLLPSSQVRDNAYKLFSHLGSRLSGQPA